MIILLQALLMMRIQPQLAPCGTVGGQFVGYKHSRSKARFSSNLRTSFRAVALSRLGCTRMSRIPPSQSTACHRYRSLPWIKITISSMCQRSLGRGTNRSRLRAGQRGGRGIIRRCSLCLRHDEHLQSRWLVLEMGSRGNGSCRSIRVMWPIPAPMSVTDRPHGGPCWT